MTDEKKPDDKKAEQPEKAAKPEKAQKQATRAEGAAGGEGEAKAKGEKKEAAAAGGEGEAKPKGEKKEKKEAAAAGGEPEAKGKGDKGGKEKGKEKGKKGKKDEGRRAGYAPKIDESLKVQPARLRVRYRAEIVPALMKELNLKNPNEVPRLTKITLNMGLGEALANNKLMESAVDQLAVIAGQKPVVTKSRKAIANFKLRENQSIGCMVTLRGERMYEFLDRLINVALPRVRDFKGISAKAFDGRGNYTLGVREQLIFPEINYDQIEKVKGLNVCIVTTARNDEQGLALLKAFGAPFRV